MRKKTARYAKHLGFGVEFFSDATGTFGFENKGGKASAEALHTVKLMWSHIAVIASDVIHNMRLELAIRTSRCFQLFDGIWKQVHHHGSIDKPELLAHYQQSVV